MFKFSGTVGGGTPILDYAKNSLSGERITSFAWNSKWNHKLHLVKHGNRTNI